ncbi:cellulose biosynthesis cyclic di-GMP-binding regulatory protein BcsB [Ornithinibacillus massiliensis]|uniref:Cellulose biosynthesis cyclic di-GMP-binding regulatory protein BcsB n=1 Tax=Ornithinibacillus massiliensis TaxID=1944633 RepID=A0ABS5MEL3_9BACI|nr:cellulose biosynthesis cyclic di-GMP-binding regulatory protein BcsB [Ornithinibacillus massiliensis]MBS3680749.1 cellulose biosynthesis cyclic di-GMP-binding regulatory protein BcsB [Ornithinibacillus massiliensis]
MSKKKIYYVVIIVLFYLSSSFPIEVFANKMIEIDEQSIQIVHKEVTEQTLTNEPIELYGPYAEAQFYYELDADVTAENQYIQLEIAKSSLLIDPSSMTIKVDEEPIYTESLSDDDIETVKVPLEGAALAEGGHLITVSFDGFVKEGICVPQYTTGNWMTILTDSYLHIQSLPNNTGDLSLSQYPKSYIGSLENQVLVVIPESPSMETLQSGQMIANFLSNQSLEDTVAVVSEQEVDQINGNVIIVGGTEEFETAWVKKAIEGEIEQVEPESLYLSQVQLQQEDRAVQALIVLGDNTDTILKNVELLTNNQYYEQFSGEIIQVSELPTTMDDESEDGEVTFSDIGMPDVELNSLHTKTETYYYALPMETSTIQNPSIELNLKRSATLTSEKDTELKDEVELLVLINEIPHSVDVRALEEDENGNIHVVIPIDLETIKSRSLLTLRVETTGLRMDQSCVALDQNRWIYLFNDSKLNLKASGDRESEEKYFNYFPKPFANRNEELILVLPEQGIANGDLLALFNVLSTSNRLPVMKLKQTTELEEDELKNGNVIFIGSLEEHKQLVPFKEDLIVHYEEGVPQLSEQGFIASEVRNYGFIQANPWNEYYSMVVLDSLDGENQYFSKDFLSYLQYTENVASVAVQTGPDQFFTNSMQLEQHKTDKREAKHEANDTNTVVWAIGFIGLLLVIGILIVYYMKRRKRLHSDNEQNE